MLLTIISFLVVLSVLVLVHELGHFWAARKTGMNVEEFGLGFPPRATSIIRGGTRYSLNWLPLGGFVKIKGENADSGDTDSFSSKSIPARFVVLAAGVTMNMILAWMLLSAALALGSPQAIAGEDTGANQRNERIVFGHVVPDSPAATAGIESGDVVVKIDGQDVSSVEMVQSLTQERAGQSVVYTVVREGQTREFAVTPRQNPPQGQGALGVQLAEFADVSYPLGQAVVRGAELTWNYFKLTLIGFAEIIRQLFTSEKVSGDVAGPIGIAVLSGQFAQMGLSAFLQFMAILSINLAIINALPIPALDGGRIMFLAIEAIRGKKVRAHIEQYSHAIGFALLLALMLMATVNDLVKNVGWIGRIFS